MPTDAHAVGGMTQSLTVGTGLAPMREAPAGPGPMESMLRAKTLAQPAQELPSLWSPVAPVAQAVEAPRDVATPEQKKAAPVETMNAPRLQPLGVHLSSQTAVQAKATVAPSGTRSRSAGARRSSRERGASRHVPG